MQLIYLPNFITVLRLFLVPVIVWLIVTDELFGAFLVFLVAGITDALDGFLARRFGWHTELGAYLDPVADKALLMSVYAALGFYHYLPAWLVILVISRDLLIIGAVMLSWLMSRAGSIRPLMISKLNTVLQISLAVLVLAEGGARIGLGSYIPPLIWMTGLTTGLSAAVYLVIWLRRMARYDLDERLKRGGRDTERLR